MHLKSVGQDRCHIGGVLYKSDSVLKDLIDLTRNKTGYNLYRVLHVQRVYGQLELVFDFAHI